MVQHRNLPPDEFLGLAALVFRITQGIHEPKTSYPGDRPTLYLRTTQPTPLGSQRPKNGGAKTIATRNPMSHVSTGVVSEFSNSSPINAGNAKKSPLYCKLLNFVSVFFYICKAGGA